MIKGDLQHNWELLFRNTDLLRDMIDKYYPFKTKNQITVAQIKMLVCVMRHEPDGVMLKDIANELELTPGAVSQMVEHLVRMSCWNAVHQRPIGVPSV